MSQVMLIYNSIGGEGEWGERENMKIEIGRERGKKGRYWEEGGTGGGGETGRGRGDMRRKGRQGEEGDSVLQDSATNRSFSQSGFEPLFVHA